MLIDAIAVVRASTAITTINTSVITDLLHELKFG